MRQLLLECKNNDACKEAKNIDKNRPWLFAQERHGSNSLRSIEGSSLIDYDELIDPSYGGGLDFNSSKRCVPRRNCYTNQNPDE